MADDPIEVEVVCGRCEGVREPRGCKVLCDGTGVQLATLAIGSLDDALHRLGLATARLYEVGAQVAEQVPERVVETYAALEITYQRALVAVRNLQKGNNDGG